MLEKYYKLQPKPRTTDELKVALQTIWEELPKEHINKAVANFTKRFTAYLAVAADDGHFKHLRLYPSPSLHPHLITNIPALCRATSRLQLVKTPLGTLRMEGLNFASSHNKVSVETA